jgi:hypothetical protein
MLNSSPDWAIRSFRPSADNSGSGFSLTVMDRKANHESR